MEAVFNWLYAQNAPSLWMIFFLQNFTIVVLALLVGIMLDGNPKQTITKFTRKEIFCTFITLCINTLITFVGFYLHQNGWITFDFSLNIKKNVLDLLILILTMDFLLFAFHVFVHRVPFFYQIHHLHHTYKNTTVIDLFVLHPIEVIGFGTIWLGVLLMYNFSIYAVSIYLMFNVLMGVVGHVEREVFPLKPNAKWAYFFANTRFHRKHHQNQDINFGFYLSIWDYFIKTIDIKKMDA